MQMGKVIGTVVASRKEDVLEGMQFLVVKNCDFDGNLRGPSVVAVDAVGAGIGEVVLYCQRQQRAADQADRQQAGGRHDHGDRGPGGGGRGAPVHEVGARPVRAPARPADSDAPKG